MPAGKLLASGSLKTTRYNIRKHAANTLSCCCFSYLFFFVINKPPRLLKWPLMFNATQIFVHLDTQSEPLTKADLFSRAPPRYVPTSRKTHVPTVLPDSSQTHVKAFRILKLNTSMT